MASGFIILDKTEGMTSRQAGGKIAQMFAEKKFGHIGTLDPMATGLLIIALGGATKMIPYFESKDNIKQYEFGIKWGVKTDTDDITGTVLEDGGRIPGDEEIAAVLTAMIGEYDQMPPAFSAKKINGTPAYKLARMGRAPALSPKRIHICELAAAGDIYKVQCSEGTYVRSLVRDIAEKLGTIAAASMIRRTKTNGFDIKDAAPLDFLEKLYNNGVAEENRLKDFLKPLDFGLDGIPVAKLEINEAGLFERGGFVARDGGGPARVYFEDKFIGMGEIENGLLKPKRIINVDS